MNMLDKLFSKELNRRTGAHAINIYIDSTTTAKKHKARDRSLGASAIKASNSQAKKTSKHSFFYRLNVRLPWLKLVAVCLIGVLAILDLCDLTISYIGDPINKIRVAPMSKHVRATERVLEGKMLIALTFDDGPSGTTTPQLLDILHEKDVFATFFMLGNMARNNPDIVKRVEKEGHEVASHTMYHQNLNRLSATAVQADIDEANAVFQDTLEHIPTFTRPPYGNANDTVRNIIGTPLILWSVDTLDWKNKNTDDILSTTMSQVHDGAIILMHDIHPTSVEAVPTLIDTLRANGYEFVTLSELVKIRDVTPEKGVSYYSFRP